MPIEKLEQIVALIVTAGLVAGNVLLFTPWRQGHEPRQRTREDLEHPNVVVGASKARSTVQGRVHRVLRLEFP